ncbi:MAG: TonB-dependent receptor [Marinilabiliaceae bacterium]|nr:TonB-dependent receptor [Marinilabiliaceae bacterium]
MKKSKSDYLPLSLPASGRKWGIAKILFSFVFMLVGLCAMAQKQTTVQGKVVDANGEPLFGVTLVLKNNSGVGTVTDVNGNFSLTIDDKNTVLVVSFLGMETQTIDARGKTTLNVVLKEDSKLFEEVVVVGYGKQKKESVVAAITQTTGETLERAGGVSSVGAALTGNVPGVVTSSSTGMPGEEDPKIVIRAASTWNNSDPLVLVDGVERPMNSVDISSVESISVLKDASATAVYGVRGANGVILITTKRGQEGKAVIRVGANATMKVPSKLPGKYDSYDALRIRNEAIENELSLTPNSWNDYLPQDVLDKYRNPANQAEAERYPNVDWADELFRNYAMSYNGNINVSGGTKFVKYFASADYLNEGDLFRTFDNNRGYDAGYGYNRLNVRSNLDFTITPSTTFKVNLSGSHGVKKTPWGAKDSDYSYWLAAYSTAPDMFLPQYSDGTWGYYAPNEQKGYNSVRILAISGVGYTTTNRITTDFTLDQNLDMLAKGLNFKGTFSFDNTFVETNRGVNDLYNDTQSSWINPDTGEVTYKNSFDGTNRFDFQEGINWAISAGEVDNWKTARRMFYQMQLNYDIPLGDVHDVNLMGVFSRNENATGSEIPHFREDWVFRATYNLNRKYTIEYNGAYNGSEKFSADNRFAFFSSGGLGWMLSEENFMKSISFLDMLKLRASYGELGDDNIDEQKNGRWLYMTQWAYGTQSRLGTTGETPENSPYTWYKESKLGNPNVHWEKVQKTNVGADFAFLDGLVAGSFDYFYDYRTDILIAGANRSIPSYFGATAPMANLGRVEVNGYELELRLNKKVTPDLRLYANINYTHAKSNVLEADNAELLPDYQKATGKQVGYTKSYVSAGYYNNWDEVYGSAIHSTNDNAKLPGNYYLVDYNGDGLIDTKDEIPYGYSSTPQNTFNATLGFEWKGFSGFVQFYGVNNVTRQVVFNSLSGQNHVVYDEGSYWSEENTGGDVPMPRWLSIASGYSSADRYMFDGSYLRLKNAEIAYTFDNTWGWVSRAKLQNVRLFLNGNNIWVLTDMPDDRESNYAGTGWASQGAYPTVKRFNLGVNLTF